MSAPPPEDRAARHYGDNPTGNEIYRIAAALDAYTSQQQADYAKSSKHNRKMRRWTRGATVGALVYTVVTAFIFIVGIRSIQEARKATHYASQAANAASRQADISRDIEKRQLRAYVILQEARLKPVKLGEVGGVQLELSNVGQTPAHDGTWTSGLNLVPAVNGYGVPQVADCAALMTTSDAKHWYIGKNLFPIKDRTAAYTDTDISSIEAKNIVHLFTARICYRDIFEDPHHIDLCIYWRGKGGPGDDANHCDEGNGVAD